MAWRKARAASARSSAKAELVEVDRRRLVFRVTAEDDAGPIGQGTHERFLIMADKFLAKAEAKKG